MAVIGDQTLLKVNLITGRFHQIRAQLSVNKTPITGDAKYGSKKIDANLALYAYLISFKHPTLDKEVLIKNYPNTDQFKPFLEKAKLI